MTSRARRFPAACVASPHYLASAAGLSVLASGGNAMDAAVATNLALGVVQPYLCGYGGDLFAMVWDGTSVHAYNGSGRAPADATPEQVAELAASDRMPVHGPLSVTVPGAVDGWFTLLERFGTRGFAELARPALRWARDGFPLTAKAMEILGFTKALATEAWSEEWRRVYGDASTGGTLRQPDLARTIETLSAEGPDPYYRGRIAEAISSTVRGLGGLLSTDDLAAHTGDWVEPLTTTYRGVQVLEMPPNTQGVTALEALNLAEGFELPAQGVEREHVLIECMKLALADRDAYVTDPAHMRVDPALLASTDWAAERRGEVDPERANAPRAGTAARGGTIYLCAADAAGMCVSLIQSNFKGFGSGVTVGGWGINLQNRGSFFSLDPEHANVIAPGKRTLHTLIPAMALRHGRPWLVFGTMGGDGQAQTHLQLLTRIIDHGFDVQVAIDAPRWVIAPDTWAVAAESRFGEELVEGLRSRGHEVDDAGPYSVLMGHAHAIEVRENGYAAASDPRTEGAALGL